MRIRKIKKSIIVLFLLALVLVGCGGSNKLETLYADLDAKETYEKMISHMNENITYLKIVKDDETSTISGPVIEERLMKDGVLQLIREDYDKDNEIRLFNIEDGEYLYHLSNITSEASFNVAEKTSSTRGVMDDVLDREFYDIVNYERQDMNDSVHITVHVVSTLISTPAYYIFRFVIGEDGYLTSYQSITSDSNFKDADFIRVYDIVDIDKKNSIDTEGAIERIETLVDELIEN